MICPEGAPQGGPQGRPEVSKSGANSGEVGAETKSERPDTQNPGADAQNPGADAQNPGAAGVSQADPPATQTDVFPPSRFDAPARALAANLSAFSSKSHSGLYPQARRRATGSAASAPRSERTTLPGPPRHDFRHPSLLSEHQVRALDSLHRNYAERASRTLTAMVRGRAQVTLTEIRQCSYFDFIRSLHNPTSLQLVYCAPRKQPFVAEMTPAILFPILDRLLGSAEDDSPFPIRPFTSIEASLVNRVFQRLLDDLAASWSTGEADETAGERTTPHFRFDIRESEHNPMLMQVFGPSEPTVVIQFQLTLDSSSGPLHVCLPTKPFEAMIAALVESSTLCPKSLTGKDERREAIRKRLEACDLTLAAELAPVPIALEDLVRLRPGDIIDTELRRTSDISVRIEGQDVFRGQVVTHEGRRAMRVTGFRGEDSILGVEAQG